MNLPALYNTLTRQTETLTPLVPGSVRIYCCGPTPMMQAVAQRAADAGRDAWVSLEQVMGCGMGGCYSCVVPVKTASGKPHFLRSCTAGPVFAASTLEWEGLAHHG